MPSVGYINAVTSKKDLPTDDLNILCLRLEARYLFDLAS